MKILTVTCEICGKVEEYKFHGQERKRCTGKLCRLEAQRRYVAASRKRRFPHLKHGVGSGNAQGSGPSHHTFKTGINPYCFRKIAFDAHGEICNYCGSTKNLCVHHIDQDRHNNVPENLMVVCKSCHQNVCHVQKRSKEGKYQGFNAEVKLEKKSGNPSNGQSEVKGRFRKKLPSRND